MPPTAGSLIGAVASRLVRRLLLVDPHRVNVTGAMNAGPGNSHHPGSLTTGTVIWLRRCPDEAPVWYSLGVRCAACHQRTQRVSSCLWRHEAAGDTLHYRIADITTHTYAQVSVVIDHG
jgi:hypothetical protein